MTTYFRLSAQSTCEVRQLLGATSYIVDVRPCHDIFEIMIRDVALDRFYFIEVSASIAAEFNF